MQAIALKPDPNPDPNDIDDTQCQARDSYTLNICANSFLVNGIEIIDLFDSSRALSEEVTAVTETAKNNDDHLYQLLSKGAALDERARAVLKQIHASNVQ